MRRQVIHERRWLSFKWTEQHAWISCQIYQIISMYEEGFAALFLAFVIVNLSPSLGWNCSLAQVTRALLLLAVVIATQPECCRKMNDVFWIAILKLGTRRCGIEYQLKPSMVADPSAPWMAVHTNCWTSSRWISTYVIVSLKRADVVSGKNWHMTSEFGDKLL